MPPSVKKTTPPTRRVVQRQNRQTVLDRIEDFSVTVKGIKMCLSGRGKVGKTRLACTFPTPLLLIGTEDGRKSVAKVQGAKFVRIYKSEELDPLISALKEGELADTATVVLDTGGGLQDIITKEVLNLDEIPVQRSWGMADRQTWGIIGAQCKERFRSLLDLADTHDLNVVIIAHERNFKDDENQGAGSDMLMPVVGAALSPSVSNWLNGACDYVCQAFIRPQKVTKKVTVAGKEQVKEFSTGKNEYCLRVDSHPVYYTGFRVPHGVVLPDAIVDPHYDKLARLISGE